MTLLDFRAALTLRSLESRVESLPRALVFMLKASIGRQAAPAIA